MNNKIKVFLIKLIIIIILFITIVISSNQNNNIKVLLKTKVFNNNVPFNKILNTYKKYFGNILPFKDYVVAPVFNEKIEYISKEDYKEGIKLKVLDNYLIPAIDSGIVVFIGEKEDYGNTIIIEGEDTIWYSNIMSNVKLYDRVEKGEFIGEVDGNELYLIFKKEGKKIDYSKYI